MSSGLLRVRRYSYWHLLSKEGSNCYQFSRARYHPVVSKYAELLGFKGIRVNDPKASMLRGMKPLLLTGQSS